MVFNDFSMFLFAKGCICVICFVTAIPELLFGAENRCGTPLERRALKKTAQIVAGRFCATSGVECWYFNVKNTILVCQLDIPKMKIQLGAPKQISSAVTHGRVYFLEPSICLVQKHIAFLM